jgi:Family of unknown function (DUF5675)
MDCVLTRTETGPSGTFGKLFDSDNNQIAVTLEHSYQQPDGSWEPKIPAGSYTCQRGQHQLESMTSPFTTFQVTNVPGHTNVLLHMGNYDKDSDGCILLGDQIVGSMITHSVNTFNNFMTMQDGVDQFTLEVKSI